jgi:two-component system, NarL family, response regulator NreC
MPEAKTVKVLIVEDHPLFSRGLASLITGKLGYVVAGEASGLSRAMKIAEQKRPELAIVDIILGNESGLDLIPRLKSLDPDMAILVLSAHDERYYSERALRLGARGYIMKDKTADNVLDAIKTVMSGKIYLSETERERILQAIAGETPHGGNWGDSLRKLSDREIQIFSCIGKGLGTGEIANKLKLSAKTIDTHKEHIKLKLHCDSSHELRRFAIEWVNHPDVPFT